MHILPYVAGIITAVVTLGKFITENSKRANDVKEVLEGIQSRLNSIEKDLTGVAKEVGAVAETTGVNRGGILSIHRFRLSHDMQLALLNGFTTPRQFADMSNLFAEYVNLGGNGEIEAIYHRFEKLEMRKEDD